MKLGLKYAPKPDSKVLERTEKTNIAVTVKAVFGKEVWQEMELAEGDISISGEADSLKGEMFIGPEFAYDWLVKQGFVSRGEVILRFELHLL